MGGRLLPIVDAHGTTVTALPPVRDRARQHGRHAARVVRVVLADDKPLMHLAMRAMLSVTPDFTVAGSAANVAEAEQMILRTRPDLLITDSDLAGECGISLCRWARRASPRIIVVLLSLRDDPGLAMSALSAGAAGYLLKGTRPEELLAYLRRASRGLQVLDERLGQTPQAVDDRDRIAEFGLSRREREVLDEILHGLGNRAIARRLCISEDTVKSHVKAIFRKLGARDRGHAIALALGTAALADRADRVGQAGLDGGSGRVAAAGSAPLVRLPRQIQATGRPSAAAAR
jgi:DNA-binding NarL/FixJ family response regulator